MVFVERKYILLLSNGFRNFKQKENLFNFSCPYCGDSSSNKFKARGYLIEKKSSYMYYCHNCNVSRNFDNFLKEHDQLLFNEYKMEKLKDSSNPEKSEQISNTNHQKAVSFPGYKKRGSPLRRLKKVSQLDWDHPVKQYIQDRCIPNVYHHKLFYCPKFYQWTNSVLPGKFKEVTKDEPRLIIPFLDQQGNLFGYQGRALSSKSTLRYITIMIDDSMPKLFGLDEVDVSKTVYVTEGPIDSMFVDNCIAMAGSDLAGIQAPEKVVMIYDNEPRNKQIVDKMDKSLNYGRNIVVWPSKIEEKDINDMIMRGMSKADLSLLISQNTHSGLSGKMALSVWSR